MYPQMMFRPQDPTLPWRKAVSGSPFVLAGSRMTFLASSEYWKEEASDSTKEKVQNLCESIDGASVERALSVEAFATLLSRFTISDYTVLGTWDPCGVVQAAAVGMNLPSMCFIGLSTSKKVSGDDIPKMPILGWETRSSASTFDFSVVNQGGGKVEAEESGTTNTKRSKKRARR